MGKGVRGMVRNKRMFGLKLRRQQIIDGFIVGFTVIVSGSVLRLMAGFMIVMSSGIMIS